METLDQINDMLTSILADPATILTADTAAERVGLLERIARKIDALAIDVVAAVEDAELFREDGHASVGGWAAYTCRTTRRAANRRVRMTKLLRTHDSIAETYRAGDLGIEQADWLAAIATNPRYGHLLSDSETLLLDDALTLTAREFENCVKRWIQIADIDGIEQRHDTLHQHRDVRLIEQFDGGYKLDGTFGPAQGARLKEILDRFTAVERLADYETARNVHGEQVGPAHLARTEGNRRADALEAIFLQACSTQPGGLRPEPSVHIVMTHDAFEHALAQLAEDEPEPFDPTSYRTYRCETLGGTQLTPTEALAAAMAGHIRRVVLGAKDASISQRTRFFTGALRELLNTIDPACVWAGCEIPAHLCQADHTTPWRDGGLTQVANGKPLCQKHNRHKEHGYHTWRDNQGHWHIQRPNGTTITPAA